MDKNQGNLIQFSKPSITLDDVSKQQSERLERAAEGLSKISKSPNVSPMR